MRMAKYAKNKINMCENALKKYAKPRLGQKARG